RKRLGRDSRPKVLLVHIRLNRLERAFDIGFHLLAKNVTNNFSPYLLNCPCVSGDEAIDGKAAAFILDFGDFTRLQSKHITLNIRNRETGAAAQTVFRKECWSRNAEPNEGFVLQLVSCFAF